VVELGVRGKRWLGATAEAVFAWLDVIGYNDNLDRNHAADHARYLAPAAAGR